MTTRLQSYFNEEETTRDTTDALIKVTYIGTNPEIAGKSGKCYFSGRDDVWYFSETGKGDWYRVKQESLKGLN